MACQNVRIRVQGTAVRQRTSQGLPGPPGTPGGASDSIIIAETDGILVPGTPVYVTSGAHFDLAQAISRPETKTIGLSVFTTGIGSPATIQTQDILTLTALQWDAVTGQTGGLSPGGIYYLSAATAGILTLTAVVENPPNQRFNSRVGMAITATTFNILIRSPLLL